MNSPGGRRGSRRATAQDHATVVYPTIRDRFLTAYKDSDELDWLVEVGLYVQSCWLREENARVPGEPLDEDALWDLWDKCSEKELRDLRTQARVMLQNKLLEGRTRAFLVTFRKNIQPARDLIRLGTWLSKEILRGFVGALGIILMGLLFVWLAPTITKALRNTVDDFLPHHTQPDYKPAPGSQPTSSGAPG